MIYYYSGTGNGKFLAGRLAEELGEDCVSLTAYLREQKRLRLPSGEKHFVVVSPVYAWRLPRIIEKLLREAEFKGRPKFYFLLHCGSEIGAAEHYLKKLSEEKGLAYGGTAAVRMPENYTAMFDTPGREEASKILLEAAAKIPGIAARIQAEQDLEADPELRRGALLSHLVNPLFYRFCVKADHFRVSDACISCGLCARQCPLKNITLPEGKPSWGSRCTHCMACINYCPAEAISCGRKSKERFKYTAEKCLPQSRKNALK